jgi:hypothetical protein
VLEVGGTPKLGGLAATTMPQILSRAPHH